MLNTCKQRGVSLVELMIALVIVGFLVAAAMPSYGRWVQNQQTRTAAESILNGLQLARAEAVKNNGRTRFVLCAFPISSWEVLAAAPTAPAPPASIACPGTSTAVAGEVRVQERAGWEGSRLAQVAIIPGGATTVTFNNLGRVMAANTDGSVPFTQLDVSNAMGDRTLRITLGVGGNVRMCDPSSLLQANDPRHC